MRKLIAGIGLASLILMGVAAAASASPVLPPDEYAVPSAHLVAYVSSTTTSPVLPPDEY